METKQAALNSDAEIYGPDQAKSYDGPMMARGADGEEIIWQFLKFRSDVADLADLRDVKIFQRLNVDFGARINGRYELIDAKTDKHLGVSGNVLFEKGRIYHDSPPENIFARGWGAKSAATFIFYYAPDVNAIYTTRLNDLRLATNQYIKDHRHQTNLIVIATDETKTTENVLIPWSYCEPIFKIHQLSNQP